MFLHIYLELSSNGIRIVPYSVVRTTVVFVSLMVENYRLQRNGLQCDVFKTYVYENMPIFAVVTKGNRHTTDMKSNSAKESRLNVRVRLRLG